MSIYRLKEPKIEYVEEQPFKIEKDIQSLCENNLEELLEYKLIKSEFSLENFRIDTLAFDEKISAFVIIEFKRDRNYSVIDQGYSYLSLMLNHKADFILEYNEENIKGLNRADVDWSQSKVIFISPNLLHTSLYI